jgi:hypothetical protein
MPLFVILSVSDQTCHVESQEFGLWVQKPSFNYSQVFIVEVAFRRPLRNIEYSEL